MRSFGCIFLIASALFALAVGDPMAAFEKCKKSTNASEADVQSIMSHKPLDTKGACLLACIHSELGILKDKKINVEEMKKWIGPELKKHKLDAEKQAEIMRKIDECNATGSDGCETMKIFRKCMFGDEDKN